MRKNKTNRFKRLLTTTLTLVLSLGIGLTTFSTNISANNDEIYLNEDKSVAVKVNRSGNEKELKLQFELNADETIAIEDLQRDGTSIKNDGLYQDSIVGENGNYKYVVTYSQKILIEKDNEEVKEIVRHDKFEFTLKVDELKAISDEPTEELAKPIQETSQTEPALQQAINLNEVKYVTEDGLQVVDELDFVPNMEDVLALPSEYRALITLSGKTLIIKENEHTRAKRAMAYSSGGVSTGGVLSSGVSFYWTANSSYYWEDIAFTEIYVNGEVAYCIEPSILDVSTGYASATDLDGLDSVWIMQGNLSTQLSQDTKRKIELISNYGYGYQGHQTDAFRWATQILIFEEIGWGFYSYGSLNPSAEIAEINSLIAQHTNRPSWNREKRLVKPGEVIDLSESGISKFIVDTTNTTGLEIVEDSGDTLKVKLLSDEGTLVLRKKQGNPDGNSYVYSDGSTQKTSVFGLKDPVSAGIEFERATSDLLIVKKDDLGRPVPEMVFETSYQEDFSGQAWLRTTNEDGSFLTSGWDLNRTMYYREVAAPDGIVLDPTVKAFTPTEFTHTIDVVNNVRQLLIKKTNNETKPLSARFNLYKVGADNKETLFKTVTTSPVDGLALIDYMLPGKYIIEEVWVQAPYFVDTTKNRQEIIIEDTQGISKYEATFVNEKAVGQVNLEKTDKQNGKLVAGAEYTLFKAELNTLDDMQKAFEWIKDEQGNLKTIKPTGSLDLNALVVSKHITEADKNLEIKDLALGKYFLVETNSPNGYQLDPTIHEINVEYKDHETPIVLQELKVQEERSTSLIKMVKKDSVTKEVINFAKDDLFLAELVGEDGTRTEIKPISVVDGVFTYQVDDLELYEIREVNPPEGYLKSDEVVIVDTHTPVDGNIYVIEYFNDLLPIKKLPNTGVADSISLMIASFMLIVGGLFLVLNNRNNFHTEIVSGDVTSSVFVEPTTKQQKSSINKIDEQENEKKNHNQSIDAGDETIKKNE